ncbi:MAG: hypothetical protein O9318_11860 [Hylemonella sp.]|uniref:hypothetical protein n=1 Tax=Hylemonella sp. TaxID=2066020 RepID=UPI0022BB142D|nr:hypothetical protein [Hylemonella sp.]MCZ8253157.1 hypothetical protein [Hylemonella sp.]
MRVCLLIIMMALLPLRAGLGDVMAMERARMQTQADLPMAAMHDCHDDASQHAAAHDTSHHHTVLHASTDGTQGDHECSDCTVCHVTAVPGALLLHVPAPAGHARPQALLVTPASADPVPGLKPPIA